MSANNNLNAFLPNPLTLFLSRYSSSPPSPSAARGNGGSSDVDWREKYQEVSELLNETRAELDDFTRTSKELEEELERDLERTEKAQEELRAHVSRLHGERDDWKMKFMNLQHTHNTTSNSLQRELDATRQSVQLYKDRVRDLEMGNDDLERNERQASSSLADVEQRYGRALEDKILLEHELQDKAALEETCQRLRDELRDVNLEVTVLKDQVSQLKTLPVRPHQTHRESASSFAFPQSDDHDESLLRTEAPDLSLSDLALPSPSSSRPVSISSSLQSRLSQELFYDDRMPVSPVSAGSFTSSRPNSTVYRDRPNVTTTPTQTSFLQRTLSPTSSATSTSSTRLPTPNRRRIAPSPLPASPSTPRIPVATSRPVGERSKGMLSDMRAKVGRLEQKFQANMPRVRTNSNVLGMGMGSSRAARPPSRTAGAATTIGNVRTPKRVVPVSVPKDASPWVMIADEGAADTTMRGPLSPERPPQLPPVPNISPIVTPGPVARADFGASTSGIRPPSRTAGLRSASALGRPMLPALSTHGGSRSRSPLPPPTAFPGSLADSNDPSPSRSTSAYANTAPGNARAPSRIAAFAAASAGLGASTKIPHDNHRPTTPTFLTKPHPAVSDILRRAHTLSSPTKPKSHLSDGVLPRQRKDSHRAPVAANTKDAGVTPGKVKPRSATSPERPPPVPTLPADLNRPSSRAHVTAASGSALGRSKIGGRPISFGAPLAASRIGRPSVGSSVPRKSVDADVGGGEEDDATIRIRPGRGRSGTEGSAVR